MIMNKVNPQRLRMETQAFENLWQRIKLSVPSDSTFLKQEDKEVLIGKEFIFMKCQAKDFRRTK